MGVDAKYCFIKDNSAKKDPKKKSRKATKVEKPANDTEGYEAA